ncbi:Uncharacterised protein [Vibrio cholerae]|nr:Uncharacterised protein [Vibrio cholerae]
MEWLRGPNNSKLFHKNLKGTSTSYCVPTLVG